MQSSNSRIVIAGAGGMGALFGSIFQAAGLDVTLFDTNQAHIDAINANGLRITGFGGDRSVKMSATTDAGSFHSADIILFQCKSHGTQTAAIKMKPLVESGAVCISFQNGLGNEEAIAEVVGEANVLGGLTAMAGYLIEPGHIRDFSRVPSYIGELAGGESARAQRIATLFTTAGLETYTSADIRSEIWKKLLGNVAMSAVSGATNLTAAQCLQVGALREVSLRAMDEALAVAASEGIELNRDETIAGMELISESGGTGDNKSSLCVDILNQRPTEVDYIYGTIINKAHAASIPVPTLETLASIVKGLESHYLDD